jgi:diadenosine tetraphosphate (Ap4A) HIT family hydrolase
VSECPLCDRLSSPMPPSGGWILRDDFWAVSAHPGIAVPGWLALQTTRHVATLAELNDGEAGSLGVLLREMSTALQTVTGADRTYTYALGEGVRHVHVLVGVPLSQSDSVDRGSRLLSRILTRDPTLEQPQHRDDVCAAITRAVGKA